MCKNVMQVSCFSFGATCPWRTLEGIKTIDIFPKWFHFLSSVARYIASDYTTLGIFFMSSSSWAVFNSCLTVNWLCNGQLDVHLVTGLILTCPGCIIILLSTFFIPFYRLERVELGYWPFVKELTHSETARFIGNHPQVTNDLDKGDANFKGFNIRLYCEQL